MGLEKLFVKLICIIYVQLARNHRRLSHVALGRLALRLFIVAQSLIRLSISLLNLLHVKVVAGLLNFAMNFFVIIWPQLNVEQLACSVIPNDRAGSNRFIWRCRACEPALTTGNKLQENRCSVLVTVTWRQFNLVLALKHLFRHTGHNQLNRANIVSHCVDIEHATGHHLSLRVSKGGEH